MRDITLCHPRLQKLAAALVQKCAEQGLKIKIGETFRTVAEQDAFYAQGRTKPGNKVTNARGSSYSSFHQWGTAFDVCRADGRGAYYDADGFFSRVGAIGVSLGLEWGGNWKSIPDKPHFQLPDWGSGTSRIRSMYTTPETFMATWEKETENLPEGWVHDSHGWWWRNADGSYPKMCWKEINHHYYLFGASGYMLTGWVQFDGSKTGVGDWYYLEESGEYQGALWHAKGTEGALERWDL